MNKEEWISVGVKLFGIYLVVLAIVALPGAVADSWYFVSLGDRCNMSGASGEQQAINFMTTLCDGQEVKSIKGILSILLYFGFGGYFIRSGALAKKILAGKNT